MSVNEHAPAHFLGMPVSGEETFVARCHVNGCLPPEPFAVSRIEAWEDCDPAGAGNMPVPTLLTSAHIKTHHAMWPMPFAP